MVELVHYVLRRFLAKCLSEKALRGAQNLAQKAYNSDLELKADRLDVTTTLTKIINGKPAVSDALKNEQTIKCPRCERTFRLGYSDNEWNKVKDWLKLAQAAIRKDHDSRHEAATLRLEWRGIRRR